MFDFIAKFVRFAVAASLLAGLFAIAPMPRALAAAILVTTTNPNVNLGDGQCSLIEAINEANTTGGSGGDCTAGSAGADTIELAAGATYTLTGVDNSYADKGDNGLPVIASDITINGHGATVNRPVSGAPAFRFFFVEADAVLTLNQLTLVRGVDSGANSNFFGGGGIHNLGTLLLNDSSITGSYSYYGGGIWSSGAVTITNSFLSNSAYSEVSSCGGSILNEAGTLTVSGSTFSNNLAGSAGGGICNRAGGIVTVANSTFSDNGTPYRVLNGAAISNDGTLTITNSIISGNNAYTGGGIFNSNGGALTITDSNISNNTTLNGGGGIDNGGMLTVLNSVVSNNAQANSGLAAGGISNSGNLILSNTIVSGNVGFHGGIYNGRGSANITNSTISGNTALNAGGGIYNFGGVVNITNSSIINNTAFVNAGGVLNCVGNPSIPGNCSMTLIESTISGNTADSYNGGGLYNVGEMTVSNSTVSGNSAKGEGGGIINVGGTSVPNMLDLFNVTVTNNTADSNADGTGDGGGIWLYNSTFNAQNSLIANNHDNSPATRHSDCSGTMTSLGYNLIGDNTGCVITSAAGDQIGSSGTLINPLLGPLQNNGGPTKTHALLLGSPAIDAGNNTVCAADPVNGLDQRGVARPQGAACDIGAYEFIIPALNFPQSGNAPSTARPLFDWANVAIATSYTLQISTNQNFTSLVLNALITPSAYVMPTDLPRNTLLFWRVRANGPGGPSAWSRVRHFFSANPPGVPVLLAPAHNATVSNQQTLDWSDVTPAASYYEVQISTEANFATLLGRGRGGRVNFSAYTPEAALGSGPFFWRVRAVSGDASGGLQFSQWSAARSFNVTP